MSMPALEQSPPLRPWGAPDDRLTEKDFGRLSRLIEEHCGIKMPPAKKSMLETRLRKRLRALEIGSFADYCSYFFSPEGRQKEFASLVDVVTTNKTDFFREPKHFDFLTASALPALLAAYGSGLQRPLRVWSAGCSTGKEAYTLAMVLSEFGERTPGFDFSILATDISTRVLEHGRLAVYGLDKVAPVPEALKRKYLMYSRDREQRQVRIVPELRRRVHFRHLNFMDDDFGLDEAFDLIFCRNVLIYFERPTQRRLLEKLCRHLPRNRFLFTGHSETLNGMNLPLVQVAPSVYRKN